MRQSEIQFIRSLGYTNVHPDHRLYVALMFQPSLIAGVLALGLALQSAWLFLVLSAVLWWGAVVPARNLFDIVYNASSRARAVFRASVSRTRLDASRRRRPGQ